MIATIQLPLWTLAAAFCVLCLIPDVIELARKAWHTLHTFGQDRRQATGAAALSQATASVVRGSGKPFGEASTRPAHVSAYDWARDGDWAA